MINRYFKIIVLAVLMVAAFTACSNDDQNGNSSDNSENTQSQVLLYEDTASLNSPIVKLSWWNGAEGFSEFYAYDGHGTENQEKPEWVVDANAYEYILYDVPQSDYLEYLTKLENAGFELYDHNFGLTDYSYIEYAAKNGYAVYKTDSYMLELEYTVQTHELIFSIYTNKNAGE